jgi:hypothetical protein
LAFSDVCYVHCRHLAAKKTHSTVHYRRMEHECANLLFHSLFLVIVRRYFVFLFMFYCVGVWCA